MKKAFIGIALLACVAVFSSCNKEKTCKCQVYVNGEVDDFWTTESTTSTFTCSEMADNLDIWNDKEHEVKCEEIK